MPLPFRTPFFAVPLTAVVLLATASGAAAQRCEAIPETGADTISGGEIGSAVGQADSMAVGDPGIVRDPLDPLDPGMIRSIVVDNHSIFDMSEMDEDSRFRWAYDLANTLHVETQQSFLRQELLFEVGDCLDPFLLGESERIIRNYPFIARADIIEMPLPDGTYNVVVDTRDEWTTKLNVGIGFDDGLKLEGIELTEENLAGYGILTSLFFREDRERRDLGITIEAPRLFATRWNTQLSAGSSRVGTFFSQAFEYPFVGEVGRFAGRQRYSRREILFPYAVEGDPRFTHVLLPYAREVFEVTAAGRIGEPGSLTVFGLGFLWESTSFDAFPGGVEVAPDGDFSETVIASPEEVAAIDDHVNPTTILRANILVGQRNIRFIQRRGLDALTGLQDVRLGTELSLTVGRALGDVGSGSSVAPDDLYLRFYGFGGWALGNWILTANGVAEARSVFADDTGTNNFRDILGEVDLYAYWNDGEVGGHTFFGRISGAGGWSVARPFQLTLGGEDGLRGYTDEDFPGARSVVLTLEDRIHVDWPAPDLFDLGFTLFGDVGRMWAGDVPFGHTSSWQASVGAGLRIGFPSGTRGVIRADIAFPLTGPRETSSPVFRISLSEVLGLTRFGDEDVGRSRRPATGADLLSDAPRTP